MGHAMLGEESWGALTLLEALIKEVRFHLLDLLDDCSIEKSVASWEPTTSFTHPPLWHGASWACRFVLRTLYGDDDNANGRGYDPVVA